jgi:hypothetical protein
MNRQCKSAHGERGAEVITMQEAQSFFWVDQTLTVPGDFLEFLRDNAERFYRREKKKLRTGIARLASRER